MCAVLRNGHGRRTDSTTSCDAPTVGRGHNKRPVFVVGYGDAVRGEPEVGERGRQSDDLQRLQRHVHSSLDRRRTCQRLDVHRVDVDHHARCTASIPRIFFFGGGIRLVPFLGNPPPPKKNL